MAQLFLLGAFVKRVFKQTLVVLASLVLVAFLWLCWAWFHDSAKAAAFTRVQRGDSQLEVLALLGRPFRVTGVPTNIHGIARLRFTQIEASAFRSFGMLRYCRLQAKSGRLDLTFIAMLFQSIGMCHRNAPNKSPEPTAVGAGSSAAAVHVASRRWLSFFR